MSRIRRYRLVGTCLLAGALGLVPLADAVAETERLVFVRKEMQRRGPTKRPFAAMATSRAELRMLWEHFNQRGDLPTIRFRKNVAILASLDGSGSCGVRLHDLRLKREDKLVIARLYKVDPGEGAGCTDDLVRYTFTVAVARAELKPLRPNELRVRRREISDPSPG